MENKFSTKKLRRKCFQIIKEMEAFINHLEMQSNIADTIDVKYMEDNVTIKLLQWYERYVI